MHILIVEAPMLESWLPILTSVVPVTLVGYFNLYTSKRVTAGIWGLSSAWLSR